MKPVIFEYAYTQKDGDFNQVIYDYEDDLSKIEGKTIVECSQAHSAYVSKTKVQRESDDVTNDQLVDGITKTFVKRESDDDISMGRYIMLLTKTENQPETDE